MPIDVGRRKFIALLSGTLITWPLAVHAQQAGAVRRVGVLMNNKPTDPEYQSYYTELTQTLQKLGWRDGQNLRLDVRWSAGDPQLIRYYAGELVAMTPDLIVASSSANLIAVCPLCAKSEHRATPIRSARRRGRAASAAQ